ncbi:MAG: CBS domain-containing protein [Deltaproteobacteria bacterium]|nr:CBS domain-containing protein [Deltaproteobacteria bacterium]
MDNLPEEKRHTRVSGLLSLLKARRPPVVHKEASIEEVIDTTIRFEHSRLVYVLDDEDRLAGVISLGDLVRHVFSRSHVPKIHPRSIISMIATKTAEDIMRKNVLFTTKNEEVEAVLKKMIHANVKEIAVVDGDRRIVGDITVVDLLQYLFS